MDVISRKVLKIIVYLGVLIYFICWNYHYYGLITMEGIFSSILISSAIYLFVTVFGFVVFFSRNYLIALAITVALAIAIFTKIDKIIAVGSWLTEENSAYIFTAIAIIFLAFDIRKIIKSIKTNKVIPEKNKSVSLVQQLKEDPQFVLTYSNILEESMGRKLTPEEVIERMDGLKEVDITQFND